MNVFRTFHKFHSTYAALSADYLRLNRLKLIPQISSPCPTYRSPKTHHFLTITHIMYHIKNTMSNELFLLIRTNCPGDFTVEQPKETWSRFVCNWRMIAFHAFSQRAKPQNFKSSFRTSQNLPDSLSAVLTVSTWLFAPTLCTA